MPVLFQIHDSDSDQVLKDKLRKIFDHISKRLDSNDKTTEIVERVVTTTESGGGSSSLINHASTHEKDGTDEILLDNLGSPEDNTDLNVSTSSHGLCPKGDNDVTHFLRGDLAWDEPPNNPAGNDTEIQFNDGGSFGADSDFVWDKTNNRLGIGEGSPLTSLEITDNAPYITIHNDTHQNTAGGREGRISFRGEKADGTEHELGYFQFSHDGSGDDYNARVDLYVNNGSGSYQRLNILSDGEFRFFGKVVVGYNSIGGTSGVGLEVNHTTQPYIWITNLDGEDSDEGRETRIYFRGVGTGLQYDDTLAMIEGNHDGSAGDQKGNLLFCTNAGSDDDAPTERMRIDSNGNITIENNLTIKQGINIVCNNNEVICNNNEVIFA